MRRGRQGERGSVSLWIVGLVLVIFAVGGIAIDLWRGLIAHRDVAALVDAAAIAGGSAIDEERWRAEGVAVLDPEAVGAAVASVAAGRDEVDVAVVVAADGSAATVTGTTRVELTLLGLLSEGALELTATASAVPSVVP